MAIAIQDSLPGKKGAFIKTETAKQMITRQENAGPFGLGVAVEKGKKATYFIHNGSNQGFRCMFIANDHGDGAMIMTDSNKAMPLVEEVLQAIAKEFDWPDQQILPMLRSPIKNGDIDTPLPDPKEWMHTYEGIYSLQGSKKPLTATLKWGEPGKIIGQLEGEEPFEIIPTSKHAAFFQRFNPGPWDIIRFEVDGQNCPSFDLGGIFKRIP